MRKSLEIIVQELKEVTRHNEEIMWAYEEREHDLQSNRRKMMVVQKLQEFISNASSRAKAAKEQLHMVEQYLSGAC